MRSRLQKPRALRRIAMARKQKLDVEEFLITLFTEEVARRQNHSTQRRAQKTSLDPEMVFERWDGTSEVSYDQR